MKSEREFRMMPFEVREEGEAETYKVEGYATTFDVPYELYEWEGNKYFECVDSHALDEADLSDVVFRFDHAGRVYARTKNNTLQLSTDEHGLKVSADLSTTDDAKAMFEEIRTGLVDKMSWAFTVTEDSYNTETRTRTILKVKKVYDVSPVTFPADGDTDISARSYFDGVIEREQTERSERRRKYLKLKIALACGQKGVNE